jgi:hypothetical protein
MPNQNPFLIHQNPRQNQSHFDTLACGTQFLPVKNRYPELEDLNLSLSASIPGNRTKSAPQKQQVGEPQSITKGSTSQAQPNSKASLIPGPSFTPNASPTHLQNFNHPSAASFYSLTRWQREAPLQGPWSAHVTTLQFRAGHLRQAIDQQAHHSPLSQQGHQARAPRTGNKGEDRIVSKRQRKES